MADEAQGNTQPVFNIEKVYVKDLSVEIPHAPKIFLERANPQIEVQLHTQAGPVEEGVFEVVVMATVTAKQSEKVMFLIEAKQAGIFHVRNVPAGELETILAVMCPNILFPYLRELISNTAVRAGFAPVMLNPVNFDMLYQQHKQAQTAAPTTH